MALQTQVWLKHIQKNFFPDNSFVTKSINDNAHINDKTVHIPNAGAPSKVVEGRTTFPATISTREDQVVSYNMTHFSTDPIRVHNATAVELSYDLLSSIMDNDKAELQRTVHNYILDQWAKSHGGILRTTGKLAQAHTFAGATGKRKTVTAGDILQIATLFDNQMVPTEGRYLLLDATMYNDLLGNLAEGDKTAFFHATDAEKGILGELYGIKIMKRGRAIRLKSDAETIIFGDDTHEATELAAGIAWQESCVSHASSKISMYYDSSAPEYYGDIMSFDMRAGGAGRRFDKKGVALLVETAE